MRQVTDIPVKQSAIKRLGTIYLPLSLTCKSGQVACALPIATTYKKIYGTCLSFKIYVYKVIWHLTHFTYPA